MHYSLTPSSFVTGYLKSNDQTSLFYRFYEANNAKASVILIHGFAEHSGRYAHVINRLYKENFSILCIDLRGHGLSKGPRGDVKSFSNYEDDVKAAIKFIQQEQRPLAKLFIVAHSMGALISLRLIAKMHNTIDGLVLSSPLLSLKLSIPAWKKCATKMLASMWPWFYLSSNIHGKELTNDKKIAQSYDQDALVLRKVSARAILEIISGYEQAANIAPLIKHPFLMQVAGQDLIVDAEATKKFFNNINNKDATLKYYPDFLHEIYNEIDKEKAIGDLIEWLKQRAS